MSDEKFLELMNLYIDGELYGEELEQLESEICNNPARRQLYKDYCRIHAATRAHYQSFSEADPTQSARNIRAVQEAVRQMDRGRMISFPARWAGWAAGAAAACIIGFFGLQQFGLLKTGESGAGNERAPMTVRETHTIEAPIGSYFASRSAGPEASDPYQRPFSLVRYENSSQAEAASESGLFIQHYRIEIQRSGQLGPGNFFGFGRSNAPAESRVFRSFSRDEDINLQIEPVGYRISR